MLHNNSLINKTLLPSAVNLVQILFMNNLFIIPAEKMYRFSHIKSSMHGGVYLHDPVTKRTELLGGISYVVYFTSYNTNLPIVNCVEEVTARLEDCVLKAFTVESGENGVCIL